MTDTQEVDRVTTVGEILEKTGPLPAIADTDRSVATTENTEGYATLMHIIKRAADNPVLDLDRLQKLFDLKGQWEAAEAKKAYDAARAAFALDPPTIVKNKKVSFGEGKNATAYRHATLAECCNKIVPALAQHGLTHDWKVDYDGDLVKVTCTLKHRLGHSESVMMKAGRDTSGNKNNIQSQASTITYFERYTLLAITGLAAEDQDDDGMDADDRDQANKTLRIAPDQKQKLVDLQLETGADTKRFLAHFKIETLDDLPQYRFQEAADLLNLKKEKAGSNGAPHQSQPANGAKPRGLLD